MYKNAGDILPGDTFILAGRFYKVLDTYELSDSTKTEIIFTPVDPIARPERNKLILPKETQLTLY